MIFPPRPINNEQKFITTQNRLDFLLDKQELNQDERDYLKILGMLIYDYEEKYETIPNLEDMEIISSLLTDYNLTIQDLLPIFVEESTIINISEGKRKITSEEKAKLEIMINNLL